MSSMLINRYIITKKLAEGGMGVVYEASDPILERKVAVKLLSEELAKDQEFLLRFEQEARLVASLEHPYIVPLYDYGQDENSGRPFLVMRLMNGGTMLDRLSNLSRPEIYQVIRQLGEALDTAHKLSIIHRDIKPSNVMFDKGDNAYLTDFGLARMQHSKTTITGNRIVGTPHYMSPEQYSGKFNTTHLSDQYSFAILIYTMAIGTPPFMGTDDEVMQMHVNQAPNLEPLKHIGFNRAFQTTIGKALGKNPQKRFPTVKDFVDTLLQGQLSYSTPFPTQSVKSEPKSKLATLFDIKSEKSYRIAQRKFVIGRIKACDLNLAAFPNSVKVSRQHAEIVKDSTRFLIKDLNSRNGTYLNREKLKPNTNHALKAGDTVQLGSDGPKFEFRLES